MDTTLICGDCLTEMAKLPANSIDFILADPPYGTTNNKWDSVVDLKEMWKQYERIITPNGAIVLFSQFPFSATLAESNIKLFRYEWIWKKNNATGFLNAKRMPLKCHENLLVFYKRLPIYNPQFTQGTPYIVKRTGHCDDYKIESRTDTISDGRRYPLDVLEIPVERTGLHPTQKPVALCEYLIKTYTNEGATVLDNFMGSGTTGVACCNTNRNFIGMELDENYFTIAKERIEAAK